MICENCGEEILPGQLLCPKCGWEVQIVPEFEASVDIVVQNQIGSIADKVARTQEEEEESIQKEKRENQDYKMHLYSTVLTMIVIGAVVLIIAVSKGLNPGENPADAVISAIEKHDYAGAIPLYEEMLKNNPDDTDSLLALGNCYRMTGRLGEAISVYSRFSLDSTDENSVTAVRALVEICIETEDFHRVSEYLGTPAGEMIIQDYLEYAALAPGFSIAQDSYDQPVYVRINYDGVGDVYYTIDGSDPDATSNLYDNPILLDGGVYTLKAVSVNPHGVMSDTVTSIYEITQKSAGEVTISPESGTIDKPGYITVTASEGITVYYTDDGSTPTENSPVYRGLIVIPTGYSYFKFLALGPDDYREEFEREFDFEFDGDISQEDALTCLLLELMQKGIISNPLGAAIGRFGNYIYTDTSIISINNNSYYLFEEYYQDPMTQPFKTGSLYCVDTVSGAVFRASVDADGHYSVVSI